MGTYADALELVRRGCTQEAEAILDELLSQSSDDGDARRLLADIQLSSGRAASAVIHLSALARLRPADAANQRRLGAALLSLGSGEEAIEALQRAVALEPDNIRGHNNLGQALLQLGEGSAAIRHFERALALDANYAVGYSNLGLALMSAGRLEQAIAAFQSAVARDAALGAARINLAGALARMNRLPEALQAYDQALRIDPAHVEAWVSRGAVLARQNRWQAALESYETALRLRPSDAEALTGRASVMLSLERVEYALQSADQALSGRPDSVDALRIKAAALSRLNRPGDALRCLERVLELNPASVEGWCNCAVVHQQLGDDDDAVQCFRQASLVDPQCLSARTGLISALIPAVPRTERESALARTAFDAELAAFEVWLSGRELEDEDAWAVAKQQFFYLSYEEQSNKPLLQRYRRSSAARLAHLFDPWPAAGADVSRGRFRLGIVSAHVREHSVFNAIVQGWLSQLDRKVFETTLFSLSVQQDATTEAAKESVDHFVADPRPLRDWAQLIEGRKLDALIFPEIGIDRSTLALANLRLAPRQLAAWGHPETTGLPTIDDFVSAELFEPPDAADHYSERLVRLPHLGVYCQPQDSACTAVDVAQWGIAAGAPVFVCPGTPFKYRPADDHVLIDIARRVGRCSFVFFEHERLALSRKLHARLAAAFAAAGLDASRFLVWVPWLPRAGFQGLLRQADVFLDTLGFSGFNTMMQAIEADLPCVTLEGRYLRGRLGSGILRRLGMDDLIASTRDEYVDIAVNLAESSTYRASARARLEGAKHLAYRDLSAIDAFSRVLLAPRDPG